ncbi:NAD(P)-binding domain-containing protein [Ovoidimarina sediminis]|uniref:NAD(P)-binding domain-containing protein n=1 Tax=Ovoidimarina sediminis TaxID=3079856 RepID=UPI00290AF55B|nr:NAD(P)-binding domain-containing protein [Rhodophyticola sp. MJ-SS7]MDU8944565.1 NAD(P)-binding domain-containing protein [Rhodophyticola sp. MJ-SS7]
MDRENFLYLSDAALEGLEISPVTVADTIETALREKAAGRLRTAPKSVILPGDGRYMMSTLAVGEAPAFTILKAVSVCPDNPGLDLPAINGSILVFDAATGLLAALLDANWVTAVRTAALSAVAARRLADPNARSIAFIGTGVQARSHLAAFMAEYPIAEIRAVGRGQKNLDALCDLARSKGLEATASARPEEAMRDADIIVTSVTLDYTIEPFLDARWLKPGAFAAITDLGIPWLKEGLSAFNRIAIDDSEQEAASQIPLVPAELVSGDLTDLVTGKVPDRDPSRPAAFAFRGIALGDFAAAALAVETATERGAGLRIAR